MKRRIIETKRKWWLIGLSFIICHLSFSPAGAQTFTQKLQKKANGEGTVMVMHDDMIDKLVNGQAEAVPVKLPKQQADDKPVTPTVKQPKQQTDDKPATPIARKEEAKPEQKPIVAAPDTTLMPDGRKKVMANAVKVTGYRVQAYAGGNQRKDRQKAEQVGNTIKASYPTEPIYVHFYSPRWICRVGNYRTYEEAHQMLLNIRKLGISGASIVKGKITVQY